MSSPTTNWWQPSKTFTPYRGELQGTVPFCVYAAIAGAVNNLVRRPVWDSLSLFYTHNRLGGSTDFSVADTALQPVAGDLEKIHHSVNNPEGSFGPDLIRGWLDDGAVVILSMESADPSGNRQKTWHMFSLVAYQGDEFQVWDSNGLVGIWTEYEINQEVSYPNPSQISRPDPNKIYVPHLDEDTLVLKKR